MTKPIVKKKTSLFNICTLFVVLWGLYGFHWYDTIKGSIIDSLSIAFLGINIFIIIYCINKLRNIKKPFVFVSMNILLFVFTIYGIYYILLGNTYYAFGLPLSKSSYIIGIYRSYLPLYAFYYFTITNKINEDSSKLYFFILFFFYLFYDYFVTKEMLNIDAYANGFTNNLGYVFVSLFPFVYLFKSKPVIKYLFLAVIVGLTVIAMKRGAVLIALALLVWFLFSELTTSKESKKTIVFLSIILLLAGYYLIDHYMLSNEYFQHRLEQTLEGNASGRDNIGMMIINHFVDEASFLEKIFGGGPDYTFQLVGNWAHNDWLEILACQGVLGILVYLLFWYSFFIYLRKMERGSIEYSIVSTFFITQFIRSFISMSYSAIPTAASLILGYAFALNEMKKHGTCKKIGKNLCKMTTE